MDKRRVGVRAVIYRDGKILAVRHRNQDGTPKDFWAIPGGGLDPGETLEDGLRREMKEELGVDVALGRLLFIQQFYSGRTDCDEELEFFFLVEDSELLTNIDFSTTSHGLTELDSCEFVDPVKERVLPAFISEIDLRSYAETVQPVYVYRGFNES